MLLEKRRLRRNPHLPTRYIHSYAFSTKEKERDKLELTSVSFFPFPPVSRFLVPSLAGASFIHIIALIMTLIMVLHIRSKYTAVGASSSAALPSSRWSL